jgi:MoxR-like ATPase
VEETKSVRDLGWFEEDFTDIQRNIERVIQGKPQEVRLALATLVAEGHLLI